MAERAAAVGDAIARGSMTRSTVGSSKVGSRRALDAFQATCRLADVAVPLTRCGNRSMRWSCRLFRGCRLDVVAADPVGVNTRLGTYTNFVNSSTARWCRSSMTMVASRR